MWATFGKDVAQCVCVDCFWRTCDCCGPHVAQIWQIVVDIHVPSFHAVCGPDEGDTVVGCGLNVGHSDFAIVTLFSLSL